MMGRPDSALTRVWPASANRAAISVMPAPLQLWRCLYGAMVRAVTYASHALHLHVPAVNSQRCFLVRRDSSTHAGGGALWSPVFALGKAAWPQ